LRVLVFGHSGSGKSSLISTITADPTIVTSHHTPVRIDGLFNQYDVEQISLIDTQGVEQGDNDMEKFNAILSKISPHVIIYVYNGLDRWPTFGDKQTDMTVAVIERILKLKLPCFHLTTNIHKENARKRENIINKRNKALKKFIEEKSITCLEANVIEDKDADGSVYPVSGVVELIQSILDQLSENMGFSLVSTLNVELQRKVQEHWYVRFFKWLLRVDPSAHTKSEYDVIHREHAHTVAEEKAKAEADAKAAKEADSKKPSETNGSAMPLLDEEVVATTPSPSSNIPLNSLK